MVLQQILWNVQKEKVARLYSSFRDVAAWYVLWSGRNQQFQCGEVDVDAAKAVVDRSASNTYNVHKGRMVVLKERASSKVKFVAPADYAVRKGDALPPESNVEIQGTIQSSVLPGAIVGGDGGQAIKSSTGSVADGAVPLAYAMHGRKLRKQFTRLEKYNKRWHLC